MQESQNSVPNGSSQTQRTVNCMTPFPWLCGKDKTIGTKTRYEGALGDDGNVLYFDYGGIYTTVHSKGTNFI